MGEVEGDGIEIRWAVADEGGVWRSEFEVNEPVDADETEVERPRFRCMPPMGIGLEGVLFDDMLNEYNRVVTMEWYEWEKGKDGHGRLSWALYTVGQGPSRNGPVLSLSLALEIFPSHSFQDN